MPNSKVSDQLVTLYDGDTASYAEARSREDYGIFTQKGILFTHEDTELIKQYSGGGKQYNIDVSLKFKSD